MRSAGSSSMTMHFEGAGGLPLVGDLAGPVDGPLVVFLHGGGQTRHSWGAAQARMAERGFRALTLDLRGHGDTVWAPDGDYSLACFAEDLRRVVARLERPAALVGASLGGHAATFAVTQPPGLPSWALVLVDVVPRINPVGRAHIIAFMKAHPDGFATLDEAADAIAQYLPHRKRPTTTSGLAKNLRRKPDGRYYWHWDPRFLDHPVDDPEVVDRMEAGLQTADLPILLVRGGASDVVTDVEARRFRQLVPAAEMVDVTRATHMVAGDRNDAFNDAIVRFLDRHAPAGAERPR